MKPRLFRAWVIALAGLLAGCAGQSDSGATAPLLIFGRTGMGPGEFSYPRAAVVGAEQLVYIVDKAARIQGYTFDGIYCLEWNTPQREAGKPTGLGAGPDGRIYVADTHYARVLIYDPQGRLLEQFGGFGTGPGQFGLPTDVAVARDGCVYVSEYGVNDRVSKFTPRHAWLFSFGGKDAGEAALRRPQTLLAAPDETLWVADACNHRICHFDAAGRFLGSFGKPGSGAGELRFPYGLDRLSDGSFVVAEFGNNRVQRFDCEGRPLGVWGAAGRGSGQLAYPWAVAVLPGDRVLIVDSGNNRVQVIDGLARATWRSPE
jgi:DNA-binding beta-propeller fold protein YncE